MRVILFGFLARVQDVSLKQINEAVEEEEPTNGHEDRLGNCLMSYYNHPGKLMVSAGWVQDRLTDNVGTVRVATHVRSQDLRHQPGEEEHDAVDQDVRLVLAAEHAPGEEGDREAKLFISDTLHQHPP